MVVPRKTTGGSLLEVPAKNDNDVERRNVKVFFKQWGMGCVAAINITERKKRSYLLMPNPAKSDTCITPAPNR